MLIEKIDIVKKRYDEIYQMISNPEIIADQKKYIELNKELKEISILAVSYTHLTLPTTVFV